MQLTAAIAAEPGDRLYEVNGTNKFAVTTYYSNDPRYDNARYGWFIGTAESAH